MLSPFFIEELRTIAILQQRRTKMSDKKEKKEEKHEDRQPNYITKAPEFSCPLSTYIMWHRDMRYISCPVNVNNRDMQGCNRCPNKQDPSYKKEVKKEKEIRVEMINKKKGPIPTIGKTYVSPK